MSNAQTYLIRDVAPEERPRERLIQHGASTLSNAELLAIVLRTGTLNESAVLLAQRLLKTSGGLRALIEMNVAQLTEVKGIGEAKAVQILAGLELGRRLARVSSESILTIRSPQDAANFLMDELRFLQKEHFICLFLNTKNQITGKETLSIGTLNASLVHPREVFHAAIKRRCASIICAHNHPSGDPTPSSEDIDITRRLAEVGDIVGIEVLDHIVIGDGRYISLKEKGYM